MLSKLSALRESLRTSLWPAPVGLSIVAALLWWGAYSLDSILVPEDLPRHVLLTAGSGDDARNLLTALVSSLITLAGVMFSITMVVLSLAANQFGSRLVRTYTSDPRTQLSLGVFTMTVVYGLLALRTVQKDMPAAEVPQITVAVALLLALICLVVMLLFLSVVARLVVADNVIERVSAELESGIKGLPIANGAPSTVGQGEDKVPDELFRDFAIVRSTEEGYVQAVEYGDLAKSACEADVVIRLDYRAGAFMCRHGWLAQVSPPDRLTPELETLIQKHVLIGDQRTPTQDLEFPIRHMVDIALRALSPGINDPNTAMAVVDRLRGALSRLMGRQLPGITYKDEQGTIRIVAKRTGFDGIFDAAFNQIRQAGAAKPAMAIHLLGSIARLAEHIRTAEQRDSLMKHAEMTAAACLRAAEEEHDRADVRQALAAARHKICEMGPSDLENRSEGVTRSAALRQA